MDRWLTSPNPFLLPATGLPVPLHLNTGMAGMVAHASADAQYNREGYAPGVVPVLDMETDVSPDDMGGFGIGYNGGASTLIKDLREEWE